ncbi:MAG: ATP-binding protein [Bacillota bacterium]|nr:ATP-binding protein [Bacillota bacterium]
MKMMYEKEEYNRINSIFNNADCIFIISSLDGRIKYANPVLSALLDLPQDNFINQMTNNIISDLVHPDDLTLTIQVFDEAVQGQQLNGFKTRCLLQNGSYQWFSWIVIPLIHDKRFYAIAYNINEDLVVQEKLSKSTPTIPLLFPNTTDYFYILNAQWKFIYVNNPAAMVFTMNLKQDVRGKHYWDVFPEIDDCFLKLSEAMLTQRHITFEAFSFLTDGWVRVNAYPSPAGISVYFRDISEQKNYEQFLVDERKRLYAILNGLPGLVYLRTNEGRVIFANQTFIDIHGEPDNRKCYSILFNKEEPCSHCYIDSKHETAVPNQWQCVIKDTIYEVFQHPFEDSDGTPLCLMQLLDITKRKIAEEEIARLDQLNLVGELAASIAHEVRNPMTTVRGFLQLLKNKNALQEYSDYFGLMISELDRANSILTEFLSIAKTNNKLYTNVKLNQLIDSLYPLISADATNQDKQIVLETEEVAELTMNEREMRQLILNLTRNGLEAMNSKGTLTIKTYQNHETIVLAVQDQGTGIGQEMMERLGTPFQTTKEGGTGLGLATCYNIADRHNAKIDVESSASGTTFFVRFGIKRDESIIKERFIY